MDLKIPSAMVERQIFPKHTNSTEIGSGVVDIVATISHVLGDSVKSVGSLQERILELRYARSTGDNRQGHREALISIRWVFGPNLIRNLSP